MTFFVTGGTHLGIKSCYGTKIFYVDKEEDLAEAIRKDIKIAMTAKLTSRISGDKTIWMFEDSDGSTLFEFYYEYRSGHSA